MIHALSYETLNEELVKTLPELEEEYRKEEIWWGNERPGPHVIFGDILIPRLIRAFDTNDDQFLRRVFELINEMALSSDIRIQEVFSMTICERLIDNAKWVATSKMFLRKEALCLLDEMEKYWRARKRIN